ncbi:PQQ-binding-like beta-propeller repeat protein [Microlunatus ginsengisoli]|uniref:hypothetical protein n=1 Tax=Microlunatus ginsengisoli TaxID=363863 RepID=UPI0031D81D1D
MRRIVAAVGCLLLVAALVSPTTASAAVPTLRARATTGVTADALPTVQINGVVWTQVMIGNIVYAGGEFTSARPAGSAKGKNEVARKNLLAYDITTGKLVTTFRPGAFDKAVKTLAVSADKKTLYVGGAFTKVGSSARGRFAAVDAKTGSLRKQAPKFDRQVNALAVKGSTVYVGGMFSKVGSAKRARLAAVNASTGKVTGWRPTANDTVLALVATADGKRVIAGGRFTKLNKTAATGMGSLDAKTGGTHTWKINKVVKNSGAKSAIWSLKTDGTTVYGTGYAYGSGNFEGVFAASAGDGSVRWIQDCHGDTYDVAPIGDYVYSVGHAHYCANIGGFPDTNPRTIWNRALAVSKSAAGVVAPNAQARAGSQSYGNFVGQPAPALYTWFPNLADGSYTGQKQAAWSVVGNGTYISLGGEFPTVNGVAQQGLVRFAVPSKAPNKVGPQVTSLATLPTATLQSDGSVALSWKANWDRDDLRLSYQLRRNGVVIATQSADSTYWNRPTLSTVDTDPAAGLSGSDRSVSYTVTALDPSGNAVTSAAAKVTLPVSQPSPGPSDSTPSATEPTTGTP